MIHSECSSGESTGSAWCCAKCEHDSPHAAAVLIFQHCLTQWTTYESRRLRTAEESCWVCEWTSIQQNSQGEMRDLDCLKKTHLWSKLIPSFKVQIQPLSSCHFKTDLKGLHRTTRSNLLWSWKVINLPFGNCIGKQRFFLFNLKTMYKEMSPNYLLVLSNIMGMRKTFCLTTSKRCLKWHSWQS